MPSDAREHGVAWDFKDLVSTMNLDDQMRRYFGVADLAFVPPQAFRAGVEHMQVDFGLTTDPDQRFGLWALLHLLGAAPDLDVAFESGSDRDAARNFMDLLGAASETS